MQEIPKIIVSLTSFPKRINIVHLVIQSILDGNFKADKIILWLSDEEFPNKILPKELLDLCNKGLYIDWCKNLKSYKKLIPALKKYPNSIIVTADDDLIYPKDWLEKLVLSYYKQPSYIHCHRAHLICFDKNKNLLPYNDWQSCVCNVKPSFNNFFTGLGGVLYPPNCLYKDILNEEIFLKLAPSGDDIYFWAMAVLNDTKINIVKNNMKEFKNIQGSQDCALWQINKTKNDIQLNNIFKHYPSIKSKLKIIKAKSKLTLIEKIFSITNCEYNQKKYKVICILGLKIKIPKS